MSSLQHKKAAVRNELLSLRKKLLHPEIQALSLEIQKQAIEFLKTFSNLKYVGLYLPIQNEVETIEIHAFCVHHNIQPVYPRVDQAIKKLLFCEVLDLTTLVVGAYGILEPVQGHPQVDFEKINVLFVPGIAFDRLGNRLGYGKGYYDRTLSQEAHIKTIGLAYDFQIVSHVPHGVEDIPVQRIFS